MADFTKIQEEIDAVTECCDEMERNVGRLDNKGPDEEIISYLRGDCAELEARVEKVTTLVGKAADEAEEIIDPEPPHPADPSETPGR